MTQGRFPVVFEAAQRLVEENEGRNPVLPFIEGPFTVGCLVAGINTMFKCMIKDEEKARWVLDRCTALSMLYAKRLLEVGATSIIILDPNVMGLTLKQFQKMILPCYKRITEEIGALFILHICGDVTKILDLIPESGFCAFSFDYPQVDVQMVKKCIGDRMKIIGSVPTVTHLLNGSREDVFKISIEMIERGTDILAPSCFVAPQTPFENAKAIADAISYWNRSQTH
jgi:[methyl-Co(III) methanol-specific corrinoid protein]:coenzyme M methyltransferase